MLYFLYDFFLPPTNVGAADPLFTLYLVLTLLLPSLLCEQI